MEWPSRRRLTVAWLVTAATFAAVAVMVRAGASGLDDPDPARQRPGLLAAAASAPLAPPALRRALPAGGVVFFERGERAGDLCTALADAAFRSQAVVVTTPAAPATCAGVASLAVPPADVADALGLPLPRDGGAPVGYVVVDEAGRVRYATLDPDSADRLPEVQTMLRAAT